MAETEPRRLPREFRQQPLTARLLEDFALCPRKFLLSFFVTEQDQRRLRGGPATLHQAVRQALLALYQLGGPAQRPLDELRECFERHWDGSRCADALEEQQLYRAGHEMLERYHAAHVDDSRRLVAHDLRLTGTAGGQELVAVADLVLQGEGTDLDVIRFVTSRRPLSEAELAEDLSAQLLWLLVNQHFGGDSSRVLYYALREGRSRPVVLDQGQVARLREDLAARVGRIHREEEFAPRKGPYCRWCRSRTGCPLWQR